MKRLFFSMLLFVTVLSTVVSQNIPYFTKLSIPIMDLNLYSYPHQTDSDVLFIRFSAKEGSIPLFQFSLEGESRFQYDKDGFGFGFGPAVIYIMEHPFEIIRLANYDSDGNFEPRVEYKLPEDHYLLLVTETYHVKGFYKLTDRKGFSAHISKIQAEYEANVQKEQSKSQSNNHQLDNSQKQSTPLKEAPAGTTFRPYSQIKINMTKDELYYYGVTEDRYRVISSTDARGTFELLKPRLSEDVTDPLLRDMLKLAPRSVIEQADRELQNERPIITIVNGKVTEITYYRQ